MAVLIVAPEPPELPSLDCVDVRPGPVAAFDGDRVGLSLTVVAEGVHRKIRWSALAELDATVARALPSGPDAVIRFGDRAACRSVLGDARLATVERQLVAVARREGATLVTWTGAPPRDTDVQAYDTVIGPDARAD